MRSDLEVVLDAVLELLAPRSDATTELRSWVKVAPRSDAITELRAPVTVAPGQTTEIRTRLANDTAEPVEVKFKLSDLIAAPEGCIQADNMRVSPSRVSIPAGDMVDIRIGLHVPVGARPGLYRGVLQATNRAGLRAQLTFQVD